MAEHGVFGVEVLTGWGRRPDVVGRRFRASAVAERREVVVGAVEGAGGRGVGDVSPGRADC